LRLGDGTELRLAAIAVPMPAVQHPAAATPEAERDAAAVAALAEEAGQAVASLTDRREAQIYYEERHNDRYGRIVAHVVIAPNLWLEAELVRRGLARVETTRDTAAAATDLLAIEAAARTANRGLWALRAYRVRDAAALRSWRDSFQVVAGRIAASHKSPGRQWLEVTGLEFAGTRGRSLELEIPAAANRLFRAADRDPPHLIGADVRVRGWLRWQDGPIIYVDHPAQIEVISRSTAEDAKKRRVR
jgi:endonuclease YncB( thermonuclease family)